MSRQLLSACHILCIAQDLFPTWDFCITAAWVPLWPVPLQLVLEVEADGERVELGKGAEDAANELHAGHVGEDVAHAHHMEAAVRVSGEGAEPREDAEDVRTQAWNSVCREELGVPAQRHHAHSAGAPPTAELSAQSSQATAVKG